MLTSQVCVFVLLFSLQTSLQIGLCTLCTLHKINFISFKFQKQFTVHKEISHYFFMTRYVSINVITYRLLN